MAKSGNLKWSIAFVALLVLFVVSRQRPARDAAPPEKPVAVRTNELADQYTGIPAPQPMEEWLSEPVERLPEPEWEDASTLFDGHSEKPNSAPENDHSRKQVHEELDLQMNGADPVSERLPVPLKREQPKATGHVDNGAPEVPATRKLEQATELPNGVQIKIVHHIEYGKALARRGAVFGAKQEFESALRLVAQSIDNQLGSREYSTRLFDATVALEEADDFYFAQAENRGMVDVQGLAGRHRSKVLSRAEASSLTPMDAMQAYYNLVEKNLVVCSGHTVVAGEALYSLGKLYNMKSNSSLDGSRLDNAKAIVFHRAALKCDPRNYKSANELAVLYAKAGRFDLARDLLLQSLKVQQSPKVWQNLAMVHRQLGEERLAMSAESEYHRMLEQPVSAQTSSIKWISPEEFASQPADAIPDRTAKNRPITPPAQQPSYREESSVRKALKRLF